MSISFRRALLFASVAFLLVLAADVLTSLAFQTGHPEYQYAFLMKHALFLIAVLFLSGFGAWTGFFVIRKRPPSWGLTFLLGVVYGLATLIAGPGSLVLGGSMGAALWMLLGSTAFSVGAWFFPRPLRRLVLENVPLANKEN